MESIYYTAIGLRLKHALLLRNKTPSDLAQLSGVSRSTVSAWLTGKKLTLHSLELISRNLDISVNWILMGVGEPEGSVSLKLSDKEQALIYLGRCISYSFFDLAFAFLNLFELHNNELGKRLGSGTAARVVNNANTAMAIASQDGTILEANEFHDELLGISKSTREEKQMKSYDFVAHEFHSKLNQAKQLTFKNGVDGYHYFELVHYQNKKRIPVITKSILIEYRGELAIKVIIKPIGY